MDKTGMIKELLENWGKVNLFTRPRRFGKSLNMSMLRHFFEIGTDKSLFDRLAISKETELCEQYMGQYPVITLSLKDVRGRDFSSAVAGLWSTVSMEANRLEMLYQLSASDKLDSADKEQLLNLRTKKEDLESSVRTLSFLLSKHCGKPCIVLIDEYDVPLQKADEADYYREMVTFISTFFSSGMKSNDNILFSVVTGCLRIARESIFTGFNNPKLHTITDEQYDEWFGFTDSEVKEMLAYYDKSEYYELTKAWYDGYRFGDVIALLIEGGSVKKHIRFDITYSELDDNIDNLWSVLFSTGYLTQRGREADGRYELAIPNKEVTDIFKNKGDVWFRDRVLSDGDGLQMFYEALDYEDAEALENCLLDYMADTISYHDSGTSDDKENFYHGLLIGMLGHRGGWIVKSYDETIHRMVSLHAKANREGGNGRPDIVTYPKHTPIHQQRFAIIIEVKYSKKESDLEADARKALDQIDRLKYDNYFGSRKPEKIVHYGIAFYMKECRVLMG